MLYKRIKRNKPVILITHSTFQSKIQLFIISLAVYLSGGSPRLVSSNNIKTISVFDGLILYGGVDINPERYNKQKKPNYFYDNDRDQMELRYLEIANINKLPVLGICRGAQLINIYHGGTLHMDVSKAYEKAMYPSHLMGYIFFRKKVFIKKDSLLHKIIKKEAVKVNSIHRQSIDKLGFGLKATAFEANKVIQSIENDDERFYLGVQFHPEFLIYRRRVRNLFNAFIRGVF